MAGARCKGDPISHNFSTGFRQDVFGFYSSRRGKALEERLELLERTIKGLELDWTTVYDKVRKAMGRIVKTNALLEAKENAEHGDGSGDLAGPDSAGSSGLSLAGVGGLSPRQKELQQKILRQRVGLT